jgi:hypothetical protein
MGPNYDRQPDLNPQAALPEVDLLGKGSEASPLRPNQSPESFAAGELKPVTTSPVSAQDQTSVSANPLILDNQKPTTPPPTTTLSSTNPAVATDNDLIEKEWVTKAKEIVEKTKHDPHLETKEISLFRADYLKKRYNKELKVAEQ